MYGHVPGFSRFAAVPIKKTSLCCLHIKQHQQHPPQKLFVTTTRTTISRDGERKKKAKGFFKAVKLKVIAYIDGRSQISILMLRQNAC